MSNDFITVEDLKLELTIDQVDTDDDSLLESVADSVWSLWQQLTNRSWNKVLYTEYHSTETGCNRIVLKNSPVEAIGLLADDQDWVYPTDSEIDSADFNFDPDTGEVYYNGFFNAGFRNVKVTYTGGYTTSNFPASFKKVIVRQGAYWFRQAKQFSELKVDTLLYDFKWMVAQTKRW